MATIYALEEDVRYIRKGYGMVRLKSIEEIKGGYLIGVNDNSNHSIEYIPVPMSVVVENRKASRTNPAFSCR